MKRPQLLVVAWLLVAGFFLLSVADLSSARPPCRAAAKVQVAATSVASVQAGVVAVPFAVPVAMPSYVQYSAYVASAASPYSSHVAATSTNGACLVPAHGNADAARPQATAAKTASLVAAHCGRCHGATQPKAGLDLTAALDDATRLKAIARVLADDPQLRMSKGEELGPDELGRLIQELSTRLAAEASEVPPAPARNLGE